MNAPMLSAQQVTMQFGHVTAAEDVSFTVGPGEIVGLLGANGAGKTTVIRVLLGLLAPTSGTSTLLGGPPDATRRARLGYVPQGLGLYSDLTTAENVAFTASIYRTPAPPLRPPLDTVADTLVGALGLGLQRQLAFECALLHAPEVLVLDEPTSGVGALARARLWDVIHEQSQRGVGVLVTTHYMQEAQQCDRLLLMSNGRLVAQGSEADIVGDTRAVAVTAPDWALAFDALSAAGLMVTLAGTRVRVVNADPVAVHDVLHAAGLAAQIDAVPATIEERMTVLAAP